MSPAGGRRPQFNPLGVSYANSILAGIAEETMERMGIGAAEEALRVQSVRSLRRSLQHYRRRFL